MKLQLPLRRRRQVGEPKRRRTLTRAQRTERRKAITEGVGAAAFAVGVGCIGFVIAGLVLGVGLGLVVAGAALVAVGNV